RHRFVLVMRLSHLEHRVANAYYGVMNDTIRRRIFRDLLRPESTLQEADEGFRAPRMQVGIHALQPLRDVALAMMGSDIPEVSVGVLYCRGALAILLISRFINQSRPSGHG